MGLRRIVGTCLLAFVGAPSLSAGELPSFGLLACSLDRHLGLVVTVADFAGGEPRQEGAALAAQELVGLPCAEALRTVHDAGLDLAARGAVSLCETGPCPNPPPPPPSPPPWDPDDDIWDLLSTGVQGGASAALVACRLAAPGGPVVSYLQLAGSGPMVDALLDARGRPCSEVIAAALEAGGQLRGRSYLPLSAALDRADSGRRGPRSARGPDSIVFEFVRRHAAGAD